jgi:hypothetical protein
VTSEYDAVGKVEIKDTPANCCVRVWLLAHMCSWWWGRGVGVTNITLHKASVGVEIVAEIDMPGHSAALLQRIPELAVCYDFGTIFSNLAHPLASDAFQYPCTACYRYTLRDAMSYQHYRT